MKQVDREALVAYVKKLDLVGKLTEGITFSVSQYLDKEGQVRAHAVYRPGCSVYTIEIN